MPDANQRRLVASAEVRQRTKKTGWGQKASELWRSIFGSTQPDWTPRLLPPWLQTGNHVFEMDRAISGEAEKVKIWALQ